MALLSANEIHEGMTVVIDGKAGKVISAVPHGTGKTGRMMHLQIKTIPEGATVEKKFAMTDKVENTPLERRSMEYQYKDDDFYYFYDETSYEQVPIAKDVVAEAAPFLKENSKIAVEFLNDTAVNIVFPKIVEMTVRACPPVRKSEGDATFKEATLENDQVILVPQFIKEGDIVRVDVVKKQYLDRVRKDDKEKPDKQQKKPGVPVSEEE